MTSATAAELCAVSTLLTYDVYLPYVNPRATEKQTLFFDHCAIVGFGALIGVLGIALFYGKLMCSDCLSHENANIRSTAGISLGWLYNATGIFVASAVLPIAYCIMWRKANKIACMTGTSSSLGQHRFRAHIEIL